MAFYKNSLDHKVSLYDVDRYNMLELSLIDTITTFKNQLNHIALMTHSLRETNLVQTTQKIDNKIKSITQNLDEQVHFYTKRIAYEKSTLIDEVEYFCRLFEHVAKEHRVALSKNLHKDANATFKAHKLKNIFYNSFEFLISLTKKLPLEQCLEIVLENFVQNHTYETRFTISDSPFEKDALLEQFNDFKALSETNDIKVALSFEKEICLQIFFVGGEAL